MYIVNNFNDDVLEYKVFSIQNGKIVVALQDSIKLMPASAFEHEMFIEQRANAIVKYDPTPLEPEQFGALMALHMVDEQKTFSADVLEEQLAFLQDKLQNTVNISYNGLVFEIKVVDSSDKIIVRGIATELKHAVESALYKLGLQVPTTGKVIE